MVPPERSDSLAKRMALLREQRYRLQFLREDGKQMALVFLAIAFAYMANLRNDFLFFDGRPGLLAFSLAIRPLILGAGVASFLQLRRARWPRQLDRILWITLVVLAILMSAFNLTRLLAGRVQGAFLGCGALAFSAAVGL